VVGEFDAEPSPELLDGRLAHGIGNRAQAVEEGEDGADQDDLAAMCDHLRLCRSDRVRDTGHVDGQGGLDVRGGRVAQGGRLRQESRIGHHHVEPAEVVDGLRDCRLEEGAVAHISDAPEGVGRVQLDGPVWGGRVDVGDPDLGSPVEQCAGRRCPRSRRAHR
jgi:hypothetical protein